MAFVATSAPSGWKPGRWSQINQSTWQEEKLDNPKIVYQFQVVSGTSRPGSTTVRLKMKDQNTEVLLLDSSAQVFVSGSYAGEYGGEWQAAGGGKKGPAAAQAPAVASRGAAPAPQPQAGPAAAAAAPRVDSKGRAGSKGPDPQQGAAFEQTRRPSTEAPAQKSAPPARSAPQAATPAPVIQEFKSTSVPVMQAYQDPARTQRPMKAEGLDKTDKSMQQLISEAKNGNTAKVTELLASGIDPDGPAKDGKTPLMAATAAGHVAVVEALLGAYADPTLGKGEETPLTIAFQKGNQNLLKVLFNASFNNLNGMVAPGALDLPDVGVRSENQDVPDSALSDLKEVTGMIAKQQRERPASPEHKKYGNYSHMAGQVTAQSDEDGDCLRTASVRLAMKSLVKTNKESGLGVPASPKN